MASSTALRHLLTRKRWALRDSVSRTTYLNILSVFIAGLSFFNSMQCLYIVDDVLGNNFSYPPLTATGHEELGVDRLGVGATSAST